ncbi:TetR family transcriptional regulator [beta proteobacterium AAP121]|nr:TetR family transcriptional regulator [beta proteobacterium AAP65]KPF95162.1 TetR family transcriptional regulator [beta proteobacterium AAP121]
MRTAPSRKDVTHERIVTVAARAIRRGGFQGVGVADIMKEAGLTHGGFYAHFRNRDALLVEALERAAQETAARLRDGVARREAKGSSPLRALVETYMSERHLAEIEAGCAVAALACEMPRQATEVRNAAAERVRGLVAAVRRALPDGAPVGIAAAVGSQMVGALQLARALGDNAEGRALLKAAREALLSQHDRSAAAVRPR